MKTNIVTCPNCGEKHENHEPCPGCNETQPTPTPAALRAAEKIQKLIRRELDRRVNGFVPDANNLARLIDAETRLPELEEVADAAGNLGKTAGYNKIARTYRERLEKAQKRLAIKSIYPAAKPE